MNEARFQRPKTFTDWPHIRASPWEKNESCVDKAQNWRALDVCNNNWENGGHIAGGEAKGRSNTNSTAADRKKLPLASTNYY